MPKKVCKMFRWVKTMVQFIFKKDEKLSAIIDNQWIEIKGKLINLSMCESVKVLGNCLIFYGQQQQKIDTSVFQSSEEVEECYKIIKTVLAPTSVKPTNKKQKKEQKNAKSKPTNTTEGKRK